MTERTIFLAALEREDPAARAAYLDAACAGQPALRRRVEELLRSHREADTFLDVPVMEQVAAAEASLAFLGPPVEPGALGRLDHYEVLEVVGRGGTGVVLKARDTKLQRVVAIKVLAPRLAASRCARQRFVREAQAAAAVRDDHVVAIHAVGDDGPVPYLVMEYVSGVTLEERVRQAGALGLKEVLRVGMQVARGLAAAHAQGLVHRDIKPGNILLENGVQRVKITDFGLARAADDAGPAPGGGLAGTPLFMSPEQARGEATDHRTDLFSLGSVLYTLCAGRPPFRADTTAAVLKSVREDVPCPIRELNPDIPGWLCDLIGKLQAKDAAGRPASAREVADLLSSHLALVQQPPREPPPAAAPAESPPAQQAVPGTPAKSRSRRWRLAVAILVGLLVTLTVLAAILKPWQRPAAHGAGGATPPESRGPVKPLELRREDIPPTLLTLAGGGDPAQAPPELVAVLGDGRFLLPRVGQTAWMDQSPDGQVLAVPLDEDVVLFEAPTGAYLRTLKGPGGRVFNVTFSRDSQLLAATTRYEASGGSVRVWDLRADRVLFTNPQPGPTVACAAVFSGNGHHLFTEGNGRVHVWESRTGERVQELEIHPQGVGSMSVSPEGRRLAVSSFFGRCVKVFDWDGKKLTEVRTLAGHSAFVGVVYSPDGKFLASGDGNRFKLWNAATLAEVGAVETSAEQLTFAPDSQTLFAASTIGPPRPVYTFTRWDVGTQKELSNLSVDVSVEPVRAFHCLSRDGKALFVVQQHAATYVKAIDTATGKEMFPHLGHVAPLNVVAVSPDGRTVASAGEDWAVKLWDLATGAVRHSLSAHIGAVCGLAVSPDGTLLASGSRDGTITLWDVGSGTEVRALRGHARSSSRLQFSPDGRTLAAGGEGGLVKRWDVATGKEGSPLRGHAGVVRCVAFSPDGTRLASGGEDHAVLLHDLAQGGSRKFPVPKAINDVAFSPDGHTLAAVGDGPEAAVRLWDLDTGAESTWAGHTSHVHGLAFSPAGTLLATGAEDGTVRLWDRTAGAPQVRTIGPEPFGGGVRAVAFTPDGRYLVTANANGTVYVLRMETPH
jgi:WD40 repeat protein/tRNA A-37 threonylcarbamoyl transferase component Bud32